ncbi:MAG: hypothetical protein DMD80_22305 [Candidatus Rokuibacteriota bacterium]|nr:MAG: hypothetical protein DMD80_22305 [Candidatus Rokubacteria bacterium]
MYSHGMVASGGDLVTVAGQVGIGPQGVAGPDVGSQTRQAFENVRAIVEAAGCTMADVVRLQTFLVSADDIPGFMKARQEAFPEYFPSGVYPPNTLLVVSGLVRPELRVEVERRCEGLCEGLGVTQRSAPGTPGRSERGGGVRGATRLCRGAPNVGGFRGATRLCRGAPNVGGYGGPSRGPPSL